MSDVDYFVKVAKELGTRKPHLQKEIQGIYSLLMGEIEYGESVANEVSHALSDLQDLDNPDAV